MTLVRKPKMRPETAISVSLTARDVWTFGKDAL